MNPVSISNILDSSLNQERNIPRFLEFKFDFMDYPFYKSLEKVKNSFTFIILGKTRDTPLSQNLYDSSSQYYCLLSRNKDTFILKL